MNGDRNTMEDPNNQAQTTGVEAMVAPPVQPQPAPKKSTGTGYKIATIILAILLVAAIVVIGVMIVRSGDTTAPEIENPSGSANETETVTDDEATLKLAKQDEAVRAVVAALWDRADVLFGDYGGILYPVYDYGPLVWTSDKYMTGIVLTRSYGMVPRPSLATHLQKIVDDTDWYSEFAAVLAELGFAKTGSNYTTASSGPGNDSYLNTDTGVVCNITMGPYAYCGHRDWYNVEDAELSDALVRKYLQAVDENRESPFLVAKVANIEDSPVAPYQRIQVQIPGAGAMFYRVSPDSEWVFFTRGQSGPACSDFDTEELRKAFAGYTCYDENTHSWDAKVEP